MILPGQYYDTESGLSYDLLLSSNSSNGENPVTMPLRWLGDVTNSYTSH